jgi:ubiquinone/menaquinone biosynthesis C-methylase UbiE
MASTERSAVADGFDETAADYDEVVLHNIDGARRLVASMPEGDYATVLDVGCGTGFASLAMARRFGPERITGVDPALGMLDEFRAKIGGLPGTGVELIEADVMAMPVPAEAFDAVICSMAFHWFPDKPGAMVAMARTLKPGGIIAVLCSGRRGEEEFRRVLSTVVPPVPHWLGAFDVVQRDEREMEDYVAGAGLEPLDIWMESRIRRVPVERYLERMRVVAGHLHADMPPDELAVLSERVAAATRAAAGPRGFEYTFTKLFAIARKPSPANTK